MQANMNSDQLRQLIEDVIAPVKLGVADLQSRVAVLVPRSEYDLRLKSVENDIDEIKKRPASMRDWILVVVAVFSAMVAACGTLTTIAGIVIANLRH